MDELYTMYTIHIYLFKHIPNVVLGNFFVLNLSKILLIQHYSIVLYIYMYNTSSGQQRLLIVLVILYK